MTNIFRMNGDTLPSKLTLIAQSTYPFKVSGFGPDKKHLLLKCSSPTVSVVVRQQNDVINEILVIANDASHKDCIKVRQYVRNAIDVATRTKAGGDPCATGLYAWKTIDAKSPGANFVAYRQSGGQDFYTLTVDFKNGALPPKKK